MEGHAPWQVRWIKFVQFMLCDNCIKGLAYDIASKCGTHVFGVEFISALGMPERQAMIFVRELTAVMRHNTRLQVRLPCFIQDDVWAEMIEAYDLSQSSRRETVDPGPGGHQRTQAMTQSLLVDRSILDTMSALDFDDYKLELEDRRQLWEMLELRNAATSGTVRLTLAMERFVSDMSAEDFSSLKKSEGELDTKLREDLAAQDPSEPRLVSEWLGSKEMIT